MTGTNDESTTDTSDGRRMPPARVDHVGIAVRDVDSAEQTLFALGCERVHRETVTDGSFEWATYVLGDASRLELIAPVEGESFLTTYLDENGPGLHHVTLEVVDIDTAVDLLEAAGERVVGYAVEDGWTEAFVSPRNPTGALFQLMEYHDDYREKGDDGALFVHGEPLKNR
ncbi:MULTISPECIES: VOC family protein [Haloferax]|uniref:VOC family protein n=2 Tax=Haloferax TaxID=2251 RepID=A0A6G1Z7J3_9EURY|nr:MULTISPECIES: VOC family protein [Haloferax]KAB1185191.1 VOC family protein [Haloferax sp. CBA1149]MRW82371.1 VOC family protein [Haloferax marinisediminis]